MRTIILLLAYNRPAETARTVRAIAAAREAAGESGAHIEPIIRAALDGPKSSEGDGNDAEKIDRVAATVLTTLPSAVMQRHDRNRGLPIVLLEALDSAFDDPSIERVICIEDDVELAPTALAALLYASERLTRPHVVAAAPLRDGIPPNQCLLITRGAHEASRQLLIEFIETFKLDGAYGARDHGAIRRWLVDRAASLGDSVAPTATSQDALRALAWRTGGVGIHALPMRLVAHRGMHGQHNTPLHALRTGVAFERIDRGDWPGVRARIDNWIARGAGSSEVSLSLSERIPSALVRSAYRGLRGLQRMFGRR